MKSIVANFQFGQEHMKYEILQSKWGAGNYEVYVNQRFQCVIYFQSGFWRTLRNSNTKITDAEINIIGEMITAQLAAEGLAITQPYQYKNNVNPPGSYQQTFKFIGRLTSQFVNSLKRALQYHS